MHGIVNLVGFWTHPAVLVCATTTNPTAITGRCVLSKQVVSCQCCTWYYCLLLCRIMDDDALFDALCYLFEKGRRCVQGSGQGRIELTGGTPLTAIDVRGDGVGCIMGSTATSAKALHKCLPNFRKACPAAVLVVPLPLPPLLAPPPP